MKPYVKPADCNNTSVLLTSHAYLNAYVRNIRGYAYVYVSRNGTWIVNCAVFEQFPNNFRAISRVEKSRLNIFIRLICLIRSSEWRGGQRYPWRYVFRSFDRGNMEIRTNCSSNGKE